MRITYIALALGLMAGTVQAQVLDEAFPLPLACSQSDVQIGTPACPLEAVVGALDMLSPGYVRPYHDAGLESYAIITILWQFKIAFGTIVRGEDCIAVDEALYTIVESLSFYLPDIENLPDTVAEDYLRLDEFFANAFQYLENRGCGA
ncbi:MAG: hypothetical protein V3V13_11915 [Paracoccaceae bacterium]